MDTNYITVVYKNPTSDDIKDIQDHPRVCASRWSHALDERTELEDKLAALQVQYETQREMARFTRDRIAAITATLGN